MSIVINLCPRAANACQRIDLHNEEGALSIHVMREAARLQDIVMLAVSRRVLAPDRSSQKEMRIVVPWGQFDDSALYGCVLNMQNAAKHKFNKFETAWPFCEYDTEFFDTQTKEAIPVEDRDNITEEMHSHVIRYIVVDLSAYLKDVLQHTPSATRRLGGDPDNASLISTNCNLAQMRKHALGQLNGKDSEGQAADMKSETQSQSRKNRRTGDKPRPREIATSERGSFIMTELDMRSDN